MTFIAYEDYLNSCVIIHKIPCQVINNSAKEKLHEFSDFYDALHYAKSSKLKPKFCPYCKPQLQGKEITSNYEEAEYKEQNTQRNSDTETVDDKLLKTLLKMSDSVKLALILRELITLNSNLPNSLFSIDDNLVDIKSTLEDIKMNTDSIDSQIFDIELNTKYCNR